MHYRNGRKAKNGDKVVLLPAYGPPVVGILYDAVAGNDYCNGSIAPTLTQRGMACMCDCIHIDDLTALIVKAGLDKRPAGK